MSPTGKRQELFFATKGEAQAECEKLKARKDNFGISLRAMSPARIAEASEAFRLLEPFDMSLLDCVRSHVATLVQRKNSVSFGEAFRRWADLKKSKSKKYISEIRQVRAKFNAIQDVPICDIKADHLEPILSNLPPASRNAHMRRLRTMFNHAMKKDWIPFGSSPIARMDFAESKKHEVETFRQNMLKRC